MWFFFLSKAWSINFATGKWGRGSSVLILLYREKKHKGTLQYLNSALLVGQDSRHLLVTLNGHTVSWARVPRTPNYLDGVPESWASVCIYVLIHGAKRRGAAYCYLVKLLIFIQPQTFYGQQLVIDTVSVILSNRYVTCKNYPNLLHLRM
jgi:hypothetical protein